jgi:predicted metal-dependent peptidase
MAKEIDNALRQGALLAGKMNGKVSRDIQELLTPKIDWREVLRDFVKTVAQGRDDTSWRRYNKRLIGADIYMPTPISQKLGSVALGVDTSGSVGGEILAQFLGEVKSICDEVSPDVVDLIYWDSRVASHEKYEGHMVHTLTDSTKPRGGGGTSPSCVPKYLSKEYIKPDCVVMLTDGYFYGDEEGDWSNVGAPVLWCVIDNKHFMAKTGVTVHI